MMSSEFSYKHIKNESDGTETSTGTLSLKYQDVTFKSESFDAEKSNESQPADMSVFYDSAADMDIKPEDKAMEVVTLPVVEEKSSEIFAVCPHCGQLSLEYIRCDGCQKVLPSDVKYYYPSVTKQKPIGGKTSVKIQSKQNHTSTKDRWCLKCKGLCPNSGKCKFWILDNRDGNEYSRCGACSSCLRVNCGSCSFCLGMSRHLKCFNWRDCQTQGHLDQHFFTHDMKDHKCMICNTLFASKSNLRIHTRTHTGEKPYKCIYCEKTFVYNSALTMHYTVHHKGNTRNIPHK